MFTTPRLPTRTARRSLDFQASNSQGSTSLEISNPGQNTSIHQDFSNTGTSNSNEEVLTVLRSLQQQVSALQAQQSQMADKTEKNLPTSSNSSLNDKRKLPKELTALVRQVVKQLRDRVDNSMEWNASISFTSEENAAVTAEVTKAITNEHFSVTLVRRAARVYFLTLQRRYKRINSGKMDESRAKQRRTQRKHNKLRNRRSACAQSTSLSAQEKENTMKILTLDFMSSEETASESGSEPEMSIRRKIFMSKPLQWRSPQANNIMQSLDRKILRRRTDVEQGSHLLVHHQRIMILQHGPLWMSNWNGQSCELLFID